MHTNKGPVVAQILYSGLGGHGSVAFSLAEADTAHAWRQHMLFYGIEPLLPAYREKCKALGIVQGAVHKRGKNVFYHWWKVLRYLRRWRPDAIILHSLTLILPVSWYCRRNRCRLIVVEHTPNQVKTANEKRFSALAMERGDAVVLLTELYRQEIRELLGAKFQEQKTHIIPNGIDTGLFVPPAHESGKGPFRIGMAARFSLSKDFEGLIRAFATLLNRSADTANLRLELAGDGQTLPAAKALAEELGIGSQVHFHGNLGEDALLRFLQSLDLYVHSSKGETMSTAIMQALSVGLPILASDIPGINNLLDGKNGLLFEPGNPEDLAGKMSTLWRDDAARGNLAQNARTFAVENLSSAVMLRRYQQLI